MGLRVHRQVGALRKVLSQQAIGVLVPTRAATRAMSLVDAVDGSSTGTSVPWMWGLVSSHDSEEAIQTITTIGLDIAKSVFQVHGVDAGGQVVIRRQLKRRYVLAFFQKVPPSLSASKLAPRRTIGRASSRRSAIMCG